MKPTRQVLHPLGWAKPSGYANGIVAEGRWLFVAGQIGTDPRSREPKVPRTFVDQFEQALDNVLGVVREAGGTPTDLVRMTIYVVDRKEYQAAQKRIGKIWRRRIGRYFPAITLVEVSALLEKRAQVEIEATAVL